ncbi:hypothetical protein ACFLU4_01180 [Chloroflexota bacterium]
MMRGEKGIITIEMIIATAIIALIGMAAAMVTSRVITDTERNDGHMMAVTQVQNAGYWISRDAQMAEEVTCDAQEPNFLILTWTEQDYEGGEAVYHSVTYFFADMSAATGKLKRSYWSSAGASGETLIAEHIYYNPTDIDDTSKASYEGTELIVQLTAILGEAREIKEYRVRSRPNF